MTNNQIKNAAKWSILGEILAKMIAPITTMVLARIIDIESFGILASIMMIISVADSIINMGFQRVIVQLDFSNEEDEKQCANICFFINLLFSIILWSCIIIFRTKFAQLLEIPGKELELMIAGIILPLSAISSIQEGLYIKLLNYRILFYTRIITVIIPLVVTIPIAIITRNYWALLIGNIVIVLVKAFYLTYKSIWKPNFIIVLKKVFKVYRLASLNILDATIFWATSWIDLFLVTKLFGIYYSGLYKTGQTLVSSIISLVTSGVMSVAFSSFSLYKNHSREFNKLFFEFQRGLAIFTIPLGIGIFVYRRLLVIIILGNKWTSVMDLVGIWGFVISMIAVYGTFCREAYRAVKKPNISVYVQIIHLIFLIPVFGLCLKLSYNDFVIVRSLAFLQILLIHSFYMRKLFNISLIHMLQKTKFIIFSSLIMGVFGFLFVSFINNLIYLFVSIFICIFIYFFILCTRKEYRLLFISLIKKYKKRS